MPDSDYKIPMLKNKYTKLIKGSILQILNS